MKAFPLQWSRLGVLLCVCCLAGQGRAELPPVFQEREEGAIDSVLPQIVRPAQEVTRVVEDITIRAGQFVLKLLRDIALENKLMDGARALLAHKLDDQFFRRFSAYPTDEAFFREVFAHLPIERRGTNIVCRQLNPNGGVTFLQAQKLQLSVARDTRLLSRSELANEVPAPITYRVSGTLIVVRSSPGLGWSEWQENKPLGEFILEVFPPKDDIDLIINKGKPKMQNLRDFRLARISFGQFPRPPVEERFPLLKRLKGLEASQQVSALRKLSELHHAEAQFLLGHALEKGRGCVADWSEAWQWYQESARQTFPPGLHRVAKVFLYGEGVSSNAVRASALLEQAAFRGHEPSLALLGKLLVMGVGLPQDVKRGTEYLEFAANQGEPVALATLGEAQQSRLALPDGLEPVKRLEQRAALHHAPSAFLLAAAYEAGRGVPASKLEAWKWYTLAGAWSPAAGPSDVRPRAVGALLKLRAQMSEEEIAHALQKLGEVPVSANSAQEIQTEELTYEY